VNNRKNEPQAPRGRPICPSWLNDDAKRAWKTVVPHLDAMGVLSKVAIGNLIPG
jgi:phage terminase small subunit